MGVGKRMRFECFKRDGFQCQYCGRTPPQVTLQADHIVPASSGGPDVLDNLVTACSDCNSGKSNVPLESVSRPLAEVMDEARERRDQMDEYNRFLTEQRTAEDAEIERLGCVWYDPMVKPRQRGKYVFNPIRTKSVRTFLRRLPVTEVLDAIEVAQANVWGEFNDDENRWRYFCGVCWAKIKRTQAND